MRLIAKRFGGCALTVGALQLAGCVGDDSSGAPELADSFDFTAMFANYVDNIFVPNYQAVEQSAEALASVDGALVEYCAAIDTASEAQLLADAQLAWRGLQADIQQSEAHVLGPVVENNGLLRSRLNSFLAGELSTCGIDQAVVLASTDANFDVASRTVTQRGIGAIEYLLFNQDFTHTCPSQIVETADWDARPLAERKQLRCEYAVTLSEDIQDAAASIVHAWSPTGQNLRSDFINPQNVAESLSELSDAMFFLESEVKDIKLGVPTGISDDCPDFACPEDVESLYSENSLANVRNNVMAFATMLTGADGLGFDDIIAEAGVSELTDRMLANSTLAIDSIDGQSQSLLAQAQAINSPETETACTNAYTNPESASVFPACSLYGFVKRITDDLKVGFVAAVDVDLPDRSQSDND